MAQFTGGYDSSCTISLSLSFQANVNVAMNVLRAKRGASP
jgi:hypothetical protein